MREFLIVILGLSLLAGFALFMRRDDIAFVIEDTAGDEGP